MWKLTYLKGFIPFVLPYISTQNLLVNHDYQSLFKIYKFLIKAFYQQIVTSIKVFITPWRRRHFLFKYDIYLRWCIFSKFNFKLYLSSMNVRKSYYNCLTLLFPTKIKTFIPYSSHLVSYYPYHCHTLTSHISCHVV